MGKIRSLVDGRHQKGKGPVSQSPLDSKHLTDGSQVERVSAQTVKGVRGKGNHLAGYDHAHGVLQQESHSCLVYFD
jgi:hypothetical protein